MGCCLSSRLSEQSGTISITKAFPATSILHLFILSKQAAPPPPTELTATEGGGGGGGGGGASHLSSVLRRGPLSATSKGLIGGVYKLLRQTGGG